MAVIALCSASGSPGVTTTALGLALVWPRPVLLVEADPTGGSGLLAGYFRGAREYTAGLVELAYTAEPLADVLPDVAAPIDGTDVRFIAGPRSHIQARGLRDLWEPLSATLADLEATGQDVLVDAGRLGVAGSPEPLLAAADLTLLVTRSHLPALAAARSWAEAAAQGTLGWQDPAALLVGEHQPYGAREVSGVLGLPVVAAVADDPTAAAVHHRGAAPPRRMETGLYVRSLQAAAGTLHARVSGLRERLQEATS